MADYSYIDTGGKSQTISAIDDATALRNAANIDPHSGVQKLTSPTVFTDANVRENVIPNIDNRVSSLPTSSRTYVGSDGNRYDEATGKLVGASQDFGSDFSGALSPEMQATLKSYSDQYDTQMANNPYEKEFNDLISSMRNTNDAELQTSLSALKGKYEVKNANLVEAQKAQTDSINRTLLLGGSSRYAPISSSGIISAKDRYDMQTLADLQSQQDQAEAALRSAHNKRDYEAAQALLSHVDKLRSEKTAALTSISESLTKQANDAKDKSIQASRDGAIADLLSQGITDPAEILTYLNYDESGKLIGDFTSKEISDTLGNIAKNNGFMDLKSLTGETKNFQILKENGALSDNIDSLPPEQQLGTYLKYIKPSKTLGVESGSGNKITLTEAKSQGLPLSVVGMSENDVAASFGSETPPKWFIEKAQNEARSSVLPETLQSLWDDYRTAYEANRGKSSSSNSVAKNYEAQATQYFKDTYGEAVDDTTALALAKEVQRLVSGGKSYATAVKTVEAEASQ